MADDLHLVRSADRDARYDRAARGTLAPALLGMAGFVALTSLFCLVAPALGSAVGAEGLTDQAQSWAPLALGIAGFVIAAALVGAGLVAWSPTRGVPHVQAWLAAAAWAITGYGLAGLFLTRWLDFTVVVLVAIAAVGATVLSTRWLVALVYTSWVGWLAVVAATHLAAGSGMWVVGLAAMTAVAVGTVLSRRQTVDALAEARDSADQASVRDPLTGLVNRSGLTMLGEQIVQVARRQGDAVHCVFVDIDQLRHVNEVAGQEAGDEVVVAVADALRSVTRATDIVARWGGDEFCIVGPGAGMAPMELERRVRDRVLQTPPVDDFIWSPKVCAGGAMLAPWDSGNLDTLLGKADQEMYLRRALRRGTGRAVPAPGRPSTATTSDT